MDEARNSRRIPRFVPHSPRLRLRDLAFPVSRASNYPDVEGPDHRRSSGRTGELPRATNKGYPGFKAEDRWGAGQAANAEIGDVKQVPVGGYEGAVPITQGKIGFAAMVQCDREPPQVRSGAFSLEKGSCLPRAVAARGGSLADESPSVAGLERHQFDLARTLRRFDEARAGRRGRVVRATGGDDQGRQPGYDPAG